jgi:transcription-repair coupling factor (superfamily II helicase)
VEQFNHLIQSYSESKTVADILSFLASDQSVALKGDAGSLNAFLIAGTFLHSKDTQLIIALHKEDAAYLKNTLENILPENKVLFFPDSFKRASFFEDLSQTQIQERTETINKLIHPTNHYVIVTYPEAIFENIISPEILSSSRIKISKKEPLNVESVLEFFLEYGFSKEDFVYEPGQFSIRGGIIDIFTHGNEYPYRIELFDDEVESIRTFDPLSQRSLRNLAEITIVPNVLNQFKAKDKVPFLEVFRKDCPVWIDSMPSLLDKWQLCFEKTSEISLQLSKLDESDKAVFFRANNFTLPREIMELLEKFPKVFLSDPPLDCPTILVNALPQPSFNKNFNLLINDLNNNTQKGITNYLFADNPRQIERFHSIFEDLNADVQFHPIPAAIHEGFIDIQTKVACYTDHQIFERFHRYKLRKGFTKDLALNLKLIRELQPGDYVTHIDHGIGKFSGLQILTVNGQSQEVVRLEYKNNDLLYVGIHSLHKISKYVGKEGHEPQLNKLGSEAWKNLKKKTKAKVKDIAAELIKLYAARKSAEGFAFPPDSYLQNELEASFIYEDTPDQLKATNDVKYDMTQPHPMDRLICGDVGFGKTEVAVRAAFKAILGGKQVALLVPTTILALQHYKTFKHRLDEFGVKIDYINRFRSTKEKNEILKKLEEGSIDLVIGTHGLLNSKINFKELGLLIVDEEQKFGVTAKEKLRNLKINVDTLTLTATPIPRTLQFSLMAARDLSVIRTPPPNRQPIHTESRVFSEELIRDSIYYEVNRGGQVFFVHNRIKNLNDLGDLIKKLCPEVSIAIAHGQMESDLLEKTLVGFIEKKYDVLVCTNIIETGLDIPNANTIIVNNAHQFGMSDLHQLRGRVGRSNTKAFCYLLSPSVASLTTDARKRLKTLEEFSELGSGFNIAMRDLDIRGAGNLLGAEQSGFIADIGYETFQKILEEAIQELKETEFKTLFDKELSQKRHYVKDVQIDADIEMLIPDSYVSNIQERLGLYAQLDNIQTEEELQHFLDALKDRFGTIPHQVFSLIAGLKLRKIGKLLGFERISLKSGKLRCYFIENPQSPFYESPVFNNIMAWIAKEGWLKGLSIKKSNKNLLLVKDHIHDFKSSHDLLSELLANVS